MLLKPFRRKGPRVGLSDKLAKNTVVRGAYGVFYSVYAIALTQSLAIQAPYVINTTVQNSQTDFAGARSLDQGPLRTIDPNAPGLNRAGIDPATYRVPYLQQWNAALQQQLPAGMQATIAYVGTKGTGLTERINFNQATPGSGDVSLRRRWPQDASVFILQMRGNSVYHSLQAALVKRFASGMHYQLAYTYSHLIDEPALSQAPVPIFDLTRQRGNADDDIRHFFRGTFGYELPVGKGKSILGGAHGLTNGILGGWEMVGALSLYSGLPFSLTAGSNGLNIGESSYPDRIANGTLPADQRSLSRWFDLSAFRNPTGLLWGNAGRNILFGPSTKQLDFSVFKNFRIREANRLQFRAEFYNLTNSPQFNSPAATIGTVTAGVISVAGSEATFQRTQRLIQMALKLAF